MKTSTSRLAVCVLCACACTLLAACSGSRSATRSLAEEPLPAAVATATGARVALCIGNGGYRNAPHLRNPVHDARAMADRLRALGFDTQLAIDVDKAGLERALHSYTRRLNGAGIALLFYAGHGIQVGGRNYFVPVDASLQNEADVAYEAVDVQRILEPMQSAAKVGILLLDSCRDNPLGNRMTRSSRGIGRGLVRMEPEGGELLIVYATSPERTADDGSGEHSPFTTALLQHVGAKGVEVQSMLKRVIRDVERNTAGAQIPWQSSSLRSDVYLGDAKVAAADPVVAQPATPSEPSAVPSAPPAEPPKPATPTTPAPNVLKPGFEKVSIPTVHFRLGALNVPGLFSITGEGKELWLSASYGVILHFDGQTWNEFTVNSANQIFLAGPHEPWLASSDGILRWTGKHFAPVEGQLKEDGKRFVAVERGVRGSSRELWFIGESLIHWNGRHFTEKRLAELLGANSRMLTFVNLRALWRSESGELWLGGDHGFLMRVFAQQHGQQIDTMSCDAEITGVWSSGPGDIWAVGRNSQNRGCVLRYDGERWSQVPIASLAPAAAISGSGPDDVWMIADHPWHYDGKSWSEYDPGTTSTLYGLWVRERGDVWVVGADGTLLHYHEATSKP